MVVANQVGKGLGFDQDYHQVTVLTKNSQTDLVMAHKIRLAGQLIAIFAASLQNCTLHNDPQRQSETIER